MQVYPSACSGWSVNPRWVTAGIRKYNQSWRCGHIEERITVLFKALSVNNRYIIGLDLSMRRENTVSIFCIALISECPGLELAWMRRHWPAPWTLWVQCEGHARRKGDVRWELGLLRYSYSHLSLGTFGTWAVKKLKSQSLKKSGWSWTTSASA